MKWIVMTLLGVALSLPSSEGLASDPAIEGEPITVGYTFDLESEILGETRRVSVGLPLGYVSGASFPVIYLLDGPAHFEHTMATAKFLARNGRMPECIVIGIANTEVSPRKSGAIGRRRCHLLGAEVNRKRGIED